MATTRGTAVVTGAGRGLGAAIATMLVARGFVVEVTDVDGDAARALATQLGAAAYGSGLDVRDPAACRELAERVDAAGRLDLWVNNAGVLTTAPTWEHDDAQRQLIMD
ncbi:MAG: SDR family NAD(P)-dependent oxidoreductase, partial [Dermatophilaceae bacterium]